MSEGLSLRDRRRLETHEKLLQAGTDLFAQHGVSGTRASDISRAAGVAVGTLYFHFGDKEGLLREVLERGTRALRDRFEGIDDRDAAELELVIRDQIRAMVDFVEEDCPRARLLFDARLREKTGGGIAELLVEDQERHIRAWQARGLVRADVEPRLAARARVGMLLEVMAWWCRHRGEVTGEELVRTFTALCLDGLRAR